jgi:O-methyltransferase domain
VPVERPTLIDSVNRLQELADLVIPFAIRIVCELGLADLLVAGPRSAVDLAAETGSHAPTLHRMLRALASRDVFTEVEPGMFALTPAAELLTSRHPLSVRSAYPLFTANFDAWAHIDHSVATGLPAFEHVHGHPYYEYLAETPYDAERFAGNQRAGDRLEIRALLRAYPWAELGTVVDVGGGSGAFLAALLARNPELRGVLLELPYMAPRAVEHLRAAGVAERCEVVAGSFVETMPEGAGGYVLKRVLFECDDDRAARLLAAIRHAIPARGRLLVLDPLVEPGNDFSPSKVYDLLSLVMTGGRARYREEIEALLADAGFRLTDVRQTQMFPVIEARPA